ncbi:hypothetical protein IW261DRAFT_1346915 [Armillaria novae-zelandiae]|uniref:ATP-dependent DNA helicase n=1 Tax=Armillaria novae-zelandiae TaxID=153914 RepID=A0AA39NHG6_9AGAR|nr:hypothetical protein IW261DRAFT_1346915 [Armillaria novae-zelandiae]
MIFAGDFAQLPPPMGGESASLYGSCDGMFASNKRSQEMAMGKAIWHQVTTVVMLQQNMRQRTQTPNDEKFRTALFNICYKAATVADIKFLRSRVVGKRAASKLTDPDFRCMSIITGLNVHKDEYNRLGAIHFAEETGQELCVFYCDDKLSGAESTERAPRGRGAKSTVCFISDRLRQTLWSAVPSSSDKQIPPTLSICKGMPIMIRTNSVTELCITKGQEGTVYSWTSSIAAHSKPVLDVVFVQLVNPPADVDIAGLPHNVVPVVRTSTTTVCSLPDDTTVKVSRTQVEIAINFAMTDFASQGKT